MNLLETDELLPNGFHDAILEKITFDYPGRGVVLHLNLWVGDLYSDKEEIREAYRKGIFRLNGCYYFVVEPPDERYDYYD